LALALGKATCRGFQGQLPEATQKGLELGASRQGPTEGQERETKVVRHGKEGEEAPLLVGHGDSLG
jgi:hypothetical protein